IRRANTDGTGSEDLVTGLNEGLPSGIDLDVNNGKMYWSTTDGKIQRANLDGSNVETVHSSSFSRIFTDLALDLSNGRIYWTSTGGTSVIRRVSIVGGTEENLVEGSDFPSGAFFPMNIALDLPNGRVFWTSPDSFSAQRSKIQSATLDGDPATITDVVTVVEDPVGIAVGSVVTP
ncbi:MAG TPA: hypothetical protein VKA06_08495, partial [Spirochaetia bacterium]|nr:hypothetical protein [Spirochaetia bacterium]